MKETTIDGLGDAIGSILEDYQRRSPEAVRTAARKVANQTKRSISNEAPVGNGRKHYADGWTVTEKGKGTTACNFVVHNRTKPGLAHLLEHGHGGPHPGPSIVHIKPAEQQAIEDFPNEIEKQMRKL